MLQLSSLQHTMSQFNCTSVQTKLHRHDLPSLVRGTRYGRTDLLRLRSAIALMCVLSLDYMNALLV